MCRRRATCRWKAFNKTYNFAWDLIAIEGLHAKLCASKVVKVPVVGISRLPLGNPKTKSHLDVALVESYRVYCKGEGGGFPQVRAVVRLMCLSCPWLVLAPKVPQLCTTHFVLVLCRPMWVIEAFHFFLVPSQRSNTPFYPYIMLQARERAMIPCFFVVFCLRLTFESMKELGVRHVVSWKVFKFYIVYVWNKFCSNYFPKSIKTKVSGILTSVNEGFLYCNESKYLIY